ncbi:MAG TPA: XrtA/PEP-CTERM system TPR-repeat protein PrsT [Rhodanobacteraceae bacterium]|nr:XrtA/PEP-CTERM system TPR-repeat protein PrsT [Rhodanobacteraceae bacterium]
MRSVGLNGWMLRRGTALACAVLLLGGCGLFSGHGSVAAGDKYQAEGKYRAAYIEAKKVLQRDDKNGDAWLLLGRASLMLGDPKNALSELQNAGKYGVPEARRAVPAGEALLAMHQFDQLLKSLPADNTFKPGTKARVAVLRGDAYRALKQSGPAQNAYQAALTAQPRDPRALVGLARLATAAGDKDSATRHLQQALAAAPENPQAWVAKGDFAFESGDYAAAESDYQKSLGFKHPDWLPQDRFNAQGRLAEAQARQHQFDKALTNIEALEKMAPGNPYPHYLHAVVLYRQGHLDDAVSQLQQVLKVSPDNAPAQMLMGAVNYAQGNYSQAEMYLSNVMGTDRQNGPARKLLALTFYREGRSQQALSTLRPLVPGKSSDAELLAVLQRAVAEGAGTPKEAASQPQAGNQPGSPFTPAIKALASDNSAEAVRLLKAMPASGASTEAARSTMLTMAYVRDKQPDQAVKTAAAYVAQHPKDSNAYLLYGTALVADGKHEQARAQYNQALKLNPKNQAALMSLGSLDSVERHYKDAEGRYKTVLQLDPRNVMAMDALGKVAAVQGNKAEAIKRFEQAIAAAPKSAKAYVDLVMLYSQSGQFDEAAGTARKLAKALPDNPAGLNALGAAELNAGHHKNALEPLQQAVKLAPKVSLYRINLARAQILNKDTKDAKANLEEVVKADPGQVQATALLAFMKSQDHDLPGALMLARTLQKQSATQAAGFSLEGDLYMANKSYAKAVDAYAQGLKAHYERPLVVKSFQAQRAAGTRDPEGVLRDWLAKHADDAALRLLLAQYYLNHAQSARAAGEYERVLKAYPFNVDALNNLAWIYAAQHDPRALGLAEKAYRQAPKSASIMDTYGWALIAANQPGTALPILAKAAEAAPGDSTIQYHLAVAEVHNGDRAGARATLAALQKSGADFAEKQAAEKLYKELGGSAGN